jgi:peptidoglycan/LPS O-acetylase OafA/YrhL
MHDSTRLPSLDGWRALSVVMVLGSHSRYVAGFPAEARDIVGWVFNGSLGVRMFFIISGFLITWLMLKEDGETGRISLRRFYARRVLRILPVYFFFLAVVALLQWQTPFYQPSNVWLANLTFTTGLLSNVEQSFTTAHLWSLAVEEQFYIFWPVLVVLFGLAGSYGRALGCLVLPIVLAPACRVVGYLGLEPSWVSPLFSHFVFTYNVDSLAVGCAAAVLLFHQADRVRAFLIAKPLFVALPALLMIVGPEIATRNLWLGFLTIPFGYSFQAVGAVLLITQSVLMAKSGVYRLLNIGPVVWIGTLSYSLYIWQQLFCTRPDVFGLVGVWWMSWPGWLAATLAAACCSYYFLEQPLMQLRRRLR